MRAWIMTVVIVLGVLAVAHGFSFLSQQQQYKQRGTTTSSLFMGQRENEIRRKILQLKREGRLQKKDTSSPLETRQTSATDDYKDQLQRKLGRKKMSLLGITTDKEIYDEQDDDDDDDGNVDDSTRQGHLGSLPRNELQEEETKGYKPPPATKTIIDPSLFESDDEDNDDDEMDEQDLIDLVAQKLSEQNQKKQQQQQEEERRRATQVATSSTSTTAASTGATTGVGGTWLKTNETDVETYQPKSGSWGAFPRPKDISKAFGGGRRIGAGVTSETTISSTEETRERLRRYRERVGIDVPSERDHAADIDDALKIAGYAMQRGMYSAAVSALEKVTPWCSTNSRVGGKVFLELAMAYEAEGRTQEAIAVYTTLTSCRIEDIKANAKRLLYGIEAMQFMRNEAQMPEFSRKKIRNTFIDTTSFANIADNFDDVWNTAYIDLDRGFYKKLTESVVRGNREARQILLQATGSGRVEHIKIVQALRSVSRHFDVELEKELKKASPPSSVAMMNGKPILAAVAAEETTSVATVMVGMDEFVLGTAEQMLEHIHGKWKLQLMADRQGDGVKFDNNCTMQQIDTETMTFKSSGPAGFVWVSQSGNLEFDKDRRILSRPIVETSGGLLSSFLVGKKGGVAAAQQILSVDSVLLITRLAPEKKRSSDDGKGFFSVWRKVGAPVLSENE